MLINQFSWNSRPQPHEPTCLVYKDKPVALAASSPGRLGGIRTDMLQQTREINTDIIDNEDDPTQVLTALTPLLEAMEFEWGWLELLDQGLLDFVVSSAKQAR